MSNRHAELRALKQEIFESLHCALPGIVESFDPESQTAVIRPAVKSCSGLELPLFRDVPVHMPVSFDVSAGDHCLVVFADSDIDAWVNSGEVSEPGSDRMHSLSDGFAFVGFDSGGGQGGGGMDPEDYYDKTETDSLLFGKSDTGHAHDDRYYTETETDTLLLGKSDTGHTHDGRYYTETETDTLLSGKSATGHKHSAADITSGTLALGRGGTGQTATGATTTIADIVTAGTSVTITAAQYAYWGKVAMARIVFTRSAAVASGNTVVCTLASGKRPKYYATVGWLYNKVGVLSTNGQITVNGAITANTSYTLLATYILA